MRYQHTHKQNNTNVTHWTKHEQGGVGAGEGERRAAGMVANKGGSERGRKTGRYAKGFSMFNFQIGLSRMTFS